MKPTEKDGVRIQVENPYLENYYIALFYENDDGEYTLDGAVDEAWITPPDNLKDLARWSDSRMIAMLFTTCRKNGVDLAELIERMSTCVHPEASKTSISGILLGALKDYGFPENKA